jgi:hypothetical protein
MQSFETLAWNTGRRYTDKGQRIGAALLPGGDILMVDIDRGINYRLRCAFTRAAIMDAYDHNRDVRRQYDAVERAACESARDRASAFPTVNPAALVRS